MVVVLLVVVVLLEVVVVLLVLLVSSVVEEDVELSEVDGIVLEEVSSSGGVVVDEDVTELGVEMGGSTEGVIDREDIVFFHFSMLSLFTAL